MGLAAVAAAGQVGQLRDEQPGGLGLELAEAAAAIVTFFVLPIAFTIVANLWSALADIAPWVDLGTAQSVLFTGEDVTGEQWLQLLSTSAIWILAPFAVGLYRVLRAEVK